MTFVLKTLCSALLLNALYTDADNDVIISANGNYIMVSQPIAWDDAKSYCFDHFGTSLATIYSQQQNDEVFDLCDQSDVHNACSAASVCWIDGKDIFSNNASIPEWSDGSQMNFTDLHSIDMHSGICLRIYTLNAYWYPTDCSACPARFICNYANYQLTSSTTTLSPTSEQPSPSPTMEPTVTDDYHEVVIERIFYGYDEHQNYTIHINSSNDDYVASHNIAYDLYFSFWDFACVSPKITVIHSSNIQSAEQTFFVYADSVQSHCQATACDDDVIFGTCTSYDLSGNIDDLAVQVFKPKNESAFSGDCPYHFIVDVTIGCSEITSDDDEESGSISKSVVISFLFIVFSCFFCCWCLRKCLMSNKRNRAQRLKRKHVKHAKKKHMDRHRAIRKKYYKSVRAKNKNNNNDQRRLFVIDEGDEIEMNNNNNNNDDSDENVGERIINSASEGQQYVSINNDNVNYAKRGERGIAMPALAFSINNNAKYEYHEDDEGI